MTKTELIKKVRTDYQFEKANKQDVVNAIEATFEVIKDAVAAGDEVRIVGFGTFGTTIRKPYTGVNPQTGEKVDYPETKYPTFKSSQVFKDKVQA